jgi:phenylpyruvate tautomerase PptA (4-oxalocrotonate tautomerase family)
LGQSHSASSIEHTMGIPADHIVVLLREVPSETWAHRGHH